MRWGLHIAATWEIQLNDLCVAEMWPYVKLLLLLVIVIHCRSQGLSIAVSDTEHAYISHAVAT